MGKWRHLPGRSYLKILRASVNLRIKNIRRSAIAIRKQGKWYLNERTFAHILEFRMSQQPTSNSSRNPTASRDPDVIMEPTIGMVWGNWPDICLRSQGHPTEELILIELQEHFEMHREFGEYRERATAEIDVMAASIEYANSVLYYKLFTTSFLSNYIQEFNVMLNAFKALLESSTNNNNPFHSNSIAGPSSGPNSDRSTWMLEIGGHLHGLRGIVHSYNKIVFRRVYKCAEASEL